MKYQPLLLIVAFSLFGASSTFAQQLGQLLGAMEYHQMSSGPEKIEKIRKLELKDWQYQDDIVDHNGDFKGVRKVDFAPTVDGLGEPTFLVCDVSPEFPGGTDSLDYYLHNRVGDLFPKPNGETQNTVFIKFSVLQDGKIVEVEAASPFPDWIPACTIQRCLAAVREMPSWSPGMYKDRPVKVKMLQVFSLG